mgnify:FL=1|tara:strand:+ start:731 stop:985 length:255 start_codon:yes stop_codon:yes gene_type:complete
MELESIQEEYLKKLITSTRSRIKELEIIIDDAHYYQVQLPVIGKSMTYDVGEHINDHLREEVAQLTINLERYKSCLTKYKEDVY